MIRMFYRAATDEDFKTVAQSRGSLRSNFVLVTIPLTILILAVTYFLFRSAWAAGILGGAFFASSVWSNLSFFREMKRREAASADPKAVEVMEVEADRVADVEHLGSHGPAYCFFTGTGQALLLIGQWLLEVESFPTRAFRLHRWNDCKAPIRIESLGATVEPRSSTARLKPSYRIRDVEVFSAKPDTLQEDLDRAFGQKA